MPEADERRSVVMAVRRPDQDEYRASISSQGSASAEPFAFILNLRSICQPRNDDLWIFMPFVLVMRGHCERLPPAIGQVASGDM